MDREIRSLGAVGAGGESSYTLSYWVILKRKFGVPRNSFVHPKKKKINENFPLGLFCDADYRKIHAGLFAFQRPLSKYSFLVQNKYPQREQTGRLRLEHLLPCGFPPSSLLWHFLRGEPQRWKALGAVPWPPVRSLEGGSLHPDVNLVGF